MRRLLPLLAVVAMLAAGCGSGSRPTPEQFAAKLKATCDEFSKRAESIQAPHGGATAEAVAQVEALFGEQLDRLRQLDPPSSEAARWTVFLRLNAEVEAALNRGAREARHGNQAGMVHALKELDGLGAKIDTTGFECG